MNEGEDIMRKGVLDLIFFFFGVGVCGIIMIEVSDYDVIIEEKVIDESNVGNRMLRNMGWYEGLVKFWKRLLIMLYGYVKRSREWWWFVCLVKCRV